MLQCKKLPVTLYERYDREGSSHGSKKRKRERELPQEWAISSEDSGRCDELLSEAIYSSGIPFSFVENPAFIAFLNRLRPAYKPPTRWRVANTLLEEAYDRTKLHMEKVLEDAGRQVTLVSDGWTNQRSESVINYIAVTRQEAIFLKAETTGSARHSSELIANGLKKTIEELGGTDKVVAVVTDNASNMKGSWAALEESYPGLVTAGCASHIVNLCVEEILGISDINKLLKIACELVKYFKSSYLRTGLLEDAAKAAGVARKSLKMPGNTRWQGKLETVKSIRENRDHITAALGDENAVLGGKPLQEARDKYVRIRSIVYSYGFWEKLHALELFLEPFLKVTIALESNRSKASRIYAYFQYLLRHTAYTTALDFEQIRTIISKRFAQTHKSIYTIAYICDPSARKEQDVPISAGLKDEMADYLYKHYNGDEEQAAGVYKELLDCWNRTGVFQNNIRWASFVNYRDPADWWRLQDCTQHLKDLAIYALSINPTTGAAERNWSVHGFLHNKSRNRLSNPRVEKLVYLFQNLRVRDQILTHNTEYFDTLEVNAADLEDDDDDEFVPIEHVQKVEESAV